jgi:isopentenyl-diphosphate delta-isomerase
MADYSTLVTHEWNFGDDKILADKLKQLVLAGAKTATTGLWREDKKIPTIGDYEAIVDSNGKRFCIIQITNIEVVPFLEIDYEFVKKEGEGHPNLEAWREDHRHILHQWSDVFTDQSLVICEEFKVVQMMEEYLDIFDEQGNNTQRSDTYDNIHRLGLLHRTVHVWLINSEKQILLQKRAKNKRAYPGYWDISAAGHIDSGATSLEAAKRETQEELGLDLPDSAFTFLFSVRQPIITHSETFIDNEFNDVYLVHSDVPISEMKIQKEELQAIRWIDIAEFELWLQGKGEAIVPHEEEYRKLLEIFKMS